MKTVAVVSQKGGSGKTTLAVHLATAAATAGHVAAIIDLDPQATAASWGDDRAGQGPEVISGQAVRLPALMQTARENGAINPARVIGPMLVTPLFPKAIR